MNAETAREIRAKNLPLVAERKRRIEEKNCDDSIRGILNLIRTEASNGKSSVTVSCKHYIYPMTEDCIQARLTNLGFNVKRIKIIRNVSGSDHTYGLGDKIISW